jgi:hypothetical protein
MFHYFEASFCFLEHLESIHSIDDYNREACDPDNRCVVVKNRDDFVQIEHLDATIDYMLDSADKYLRGFKR